MSGRYALPLLRDQEQRERILLAITAEMARRCAKSDQDADTKASSTDAANVTAYFFVTETARSCGSARGDSFSFFHCSSSLFFVKRELGVLRKQVASGGGVASSGTAKHKKPKRQADGAVVNAAPSKKAGRDLLNPSQPAPKKKKVILPLLCWSCFLKGLERAFNTKVWPPSTSSRNKCECVYKVSL